MRKLYLSFSPPSARIDQPASIVGRRPDQSVRMVVRLGPGAIVTAGWPRGRGWGQNFTFVPASHPLRQRDQKIPKRGPLRQLDVKVSKLAYASRPSPNLLWKTPNGTLPNAAGKFGDSTIPRWEGLLIFVLGSCVAIIAALAALALSPWLDSLGVLPLLIIATIYIACLAGMWRSERPSSAHDR